MSRPSGIARPLDRCSTGYEDPPPCRVLGLYRGSIGIMEKRMEITIILVLYRGSFGIMENKMETTVVFRLGGPPTL